MMFRYQNCGRPRRFELLAFAVFSLVLLTASGCGKNEAQGGGPPGGRSGGPGGRSGGFSGAPAAAVPVETAAVERRDISNFIESNGVLEAENEVDIVARTSGPIIRLAVEEGDRVGAGALLARIDPADITAQLEVSRVAMADAKLAYDRAVRLQQNGLISPEDYEAAVTRYDTAKAQFEGNQILLGYTEVKAPFAGLITVRHVNFAQQVSPGTVLFRLSDFTPLLVPIQVPERELGRLAIDQEAFITVEAWPERRFGARVERIRPVIDAATGTVRVTLEVDGEGVLTPGMFARVFVQTETHRDSLVVPKAALSLESIGDTVYVAANGVAERREVELGFSEGDAIEVLSGVSDGEAVVVVGQDGLSDGTPIQVLDGPGAAAPGEPVAGAPSPAGAAPGGGRGFDPSQMSPEQLEEVRARMRQRGLSEQEIEERLERMRQPGSQGSEDRTPAEGAQPSS